MPKIIHPNYIEDLTEVGISKLLGYLPICTIKENCGIDPIKLEKELKNKGLNTYWGDEEQVFSGSLYAADIHKLEAFLSLPQQQEVFQKYNLKMNAEEFVNLIMTKSIDSKDKPELYDLIALVFNDKRKEYQTRSAILEVVGSTNQKPKLKI